ncbi:MAG: agmatine deiminase family protein [Flavobacteriales bacterium]|nr:agmatine deiminase family protein [Flavobacteriales bacterium]
MNGYTNVSGDPYEVVRIPMPPSTSGGYAPSASYRTYANNVFINKTVLVPTYRTEYDTTGLRVLRESLPIPRGGDRLRRWGRTSSARAVPFIASPRPSA